MSDHKRVVVVDIPPESTPEQAERILEDALVENAYIVAVLPWSSGARAILRRAKYASGERVKVARRAAKERAEQREEAARDICARNPDISVEGLRRALVASGIKAGTNTARDLLLRLKGGR